MAASPLTTEILPGKVLLIPPGDKRPLPRLPKRNSLSTSIPMPMAGEQKRATPQTYQRSQMLGNQDRPYGQRARPLPCLPLWQRKARASIRMRERANEGSFSPQKKPRIASFVSGVFRNEDTGPGISISHRTGDNGASHMTGFSLSDAAVSVNYSRRFEHPGTPGPLEHFQFKMLCFSNHTACHFAEKASFSK